MLRGKFNLGKRPRGIAFRLVPAEGKPSVPVVRYDAFDVPFEADDFPARERGPRRRATDRAADFLRGLFTRRQAIASADLHALAAAAGLSWRSVGRALSAAAVEAFKEGRGWSYRVGGGPGR